MRPPSRRKIPSCGRSNIYTQRDFRGAPIPYDVVFDTVGRTTLKDIEGSLAPRGRYLVTVFGFVDCLRMLWTSLGRGRRMIGGASNFHWKPEDLDVRCGLISAGRFAPVIDRTYHWHDVAAAHRYVEQGHERGNVVLLVDPRADEGPERPQP